MGSGELDSLQICFKVFNDFLQKWIAPFKFIAADDGPNDVVHCRRNVRMRIVIFTVRFLNEPVEI
jgi:hypothetical protein